MQVEPAGGHAVRPGALLPAQMRDDGLAPLHFAMPPVEQCIVGEEGADICPPATDGEMADGRLHALDLAQGG